jgi:hypothetical protein
MIVRLCESIQYFGDITPNEHEGVLAKIKASLKKDGFIYFETFNEGTDSCFSLYSNKDQLLHRYTDCDSDFDIFDERFY